MLKIRKNAKFETPIDREIAEIKIYIESAQKRLNALLKLRSDYLSMKRGNFK